MDRLEKEHLSVLVSFAGESHNLREECVGFQAYKADAEILAMKFHTVITEMWGLNMEYGRVQWIFFQHESCCFYTFREISPSYLHTALHVP